MFPDDDDVIKVQQATFDPFEYLMLRHKENMLNTDFKKPLGKISYHVACHQRVQKIGMKTRDQDMTVHILSKVNATIRQ